MGLSTVTANEFVTILRTVNINWVHKKIMWENTVAFVLIQKKIQFMQSICFSCKMLFDTGFTSFYGWAVYWGIRHSHGWLIFQYKSSFNWCPILLDHLWKPSHMLCVQGSFCYRYAIPKATPYKLYKGLVHKENEISCCQELPS